MNPVHIAIRDVLMEQSVSPTSADRIATRLVERVGSQGWSQRRADAIVKAVLDEEAAARADLCHGSHTVTPREVEQVVDAIRDRLVEIRDKLTAG